MPVLIVYLRKGTTGPITPSLLLAAVALIFSFFGDSFLMFTEKNELFFLLGLGSFAVAQVLYAISFSKAVDVDSNPLPGISQFLYAIPFALFGLGLLYMIWGGIGDLKIPVTVYATLIMTMAVFAVYRNTRSSQESINQVILGAVFFVLSDSLIAINKFYAPMENGHVFIMITYMLAQWNIVNGLQKHYNK